MVPLYLSNVESWIIPGEPDHRTMLLMMDCAEDVCAIGYQVGTPILLSPAHQLQEALNLLPEEKEVTDMLFQD